jgi:TRAP transporter TAXI family solute receptor
MIIRLKMKVFWLVILGLLALSPLPSSISATGNVVLRTNGGPVGGGKDLRVRMVAEAIRKGNANWVVDVISGPTAMAEVVMIGRGELHFGALDMGSVLDVAKGYFGKAKMPEPVQLRWLVPSTAMTTVCYMLEDVPITSFRDLMKKKYALKFSAQRKGSDPYNITARAFKAYGLTIEDILGWGGKIHNESSRRSAELIGDGFMEAFISSATYPDPNFTELERKRKLKAIFVSEPEIQAKLFKQGFIRVSVHAGDHSFIKKDTTTVAMPAVIVVNVNMKDDIAYNMTRAVWEQRESLLYPVHPIFRRYLRPEIITDWTTTYKDYVHPGAAKYWKEQGLLK